MASATIMVKKVDGRWTIGRENWPFQAFPSKEAALERGRVLVKRLNDASLVVVDGGICTLDTDASRRPRHD